MKQRKTALVTGASSGIGRAIAISLSKEGFDLVLCGRNHVELDRTAKMLDQQVESEILIFDVASRSETTTVMNALADRRAIDVLVNNAGNAHGLDYLHEGSLDDFDAMMDINVKGLLYVSHAITPGMVERGNGHIVNISSTAGKEVYEKGAVYCASKHAVEAISEGQRRELVRHGLRVTNIAPGMVHTNFSNVRFKGDDDRAENVYKGYDPLLAEDIAEAVRFCVMAPPRMQIADMTILAGAQSAAAVLHKK